MTSNDNAGAPAMAAFVAAPVALPAVEAVDALPVEGLPAFIAQSAALQARAAARLGRRIHEGRGNLPTHQQGEEEAAPSDPLLTVEQVAEHLNAKRAWVYRHWRQIGGQKLDGLLRFSARRVQSYLERQRRTAA